MNSETWFNSSPVHGTSKCQKHNLKHDTRDLHSTHTESQIFYLVWLCLAMLAIMTVKRQLCTGWTYEILYKSSTFYYFWNVLFFVQICPTWSNQLCACVQWGQCSKVFKTVSKTYLPVNPVRPNLWDWVRLRGSRSHPCCRDHGIPRHPLILINGILTGLRLSLISSSGCCFLSTASWVDQWLDDEARTLPR